jgi:hypothetical protein
VPVPDSSSILPDSSAIYQTSPVRYQTSPIMLFQLNLRSLFERNLLTVNLIDPILLLLAL